MFCPKCGQPQASDQIRFCSLCGTNLGEIAKVIARDPNNSCEQEETLTRRLLAIALYLSVAILAVTGWGPWSGPEGMRFRALAIVLSFLTFILLFSRPLSGVIYKLLPQDSKQGATEAIPTGVGTPALPPSQSIPVNGLNRRRVDTAEMLPHSVTEHTTALLEKK